jgi:hypothetical protein
MYFCSYFSYKILISYRFDYAKFSSLVSDSSRVNFSKFLTKRVFLLTTRTLVVDNSLCEDITNLLPDEKILR